MRTRKSKTLVGVAALLLTTAACTNTNSTNASATGGAAITLIAASLPTGLDPDSKNVLDSGIQLTTSMSYMGLLFSYNGATAAPGTAPKLQPDLATSGVASADGRTWTVKLRPGVRSEAGNPLTADDVLWTMQRVVATKANGSTLLSQANIDLANPVTKVDAQTVAFHLDHPSALVTAVLSLPYLGILDSVEVKKHVTADDKWAAKWLAEHSASFGPYTVTGHTAKTEMVMAANKNYWKGAPKVAKATWRTVQDPATALQTALTGQSDYTLTTSAANLATLKKSSIVEAHQIPTATTVFMTLDLKNPAVSDARVRRAIALATDRQTIADTVFAGTAQPTTGCLPSVLTTTKTSLDNAAGPQVDKAKALLAQVPGDRTLVLGTLPGVFPEGASMARIVQSNVQAAGMKVEIRSYTSADTITADIKSHKLSGVMLKQAPSVADAGYFFTAFFLGSSAYNFSSFTDAAFDKAAKAAMTQPEPARQQAIATACEILLKEAPSNMLVASGNISITKKTITNVLDYPDIAPRLYNLSVSGA